MMTGLSMQATMGFVDPVLGSQEAFREILNAMAYPGKIVTLSGAAMVPHGVHGAAWIVLLTLVDETVRLWTDLPEDHEAHRALHFLTRVQIVHDTADVDFVLITDPMALSEPYAFRIGSELDPQLGATLILQQSCLTECADSARNESLILSGPGIPHIRRLWAEGCPPSFWDWRVNLERLYPRGVDLLLTHRSSFVAIPRSVLVQRRRDYLCMSR